MLRKLLTVVLLLSCALGAFGQTRSGRPRLGILPFAGGVGGDGETIAELFSHQSTGLGNAFTLVPRTNAVNALVAEQNFQLQGYTDSDTIARLGKLLNADFVLSGHIASLGDRKLAIATLVNVETFEQLAGVYREYWNIEEVEELLPEMARVLIAASRRDTSKLPKLAIMPFDFSQVPGINVKEAEVLAQILAVEIANMEKYAVLPRTSALQDAMNELQYQMTGATAEDEAKALGRAINAEYVLAAAVRRLGGSNMFNASILDVEDGSQLVGDSRRYREVSDGLSLMKQLAWLLLNPGVDVAMRPTDIFRVQEPEPEPEPELPIVREPVDPELTRFKTFGIAAGTTFTIPWLVSTVHFTVSPAMYTYLEFAFDFGLFTRMDEVDYYSLFPYAHLGGFWPFAQVPWSFFMPFKKGGLYLGVGAGYMMANYTFPEGEAKVNSLVYSLTTGINLGNFFNISYTWRVGDDFDFGKTNSKLSIGFVKRYIKSAGVKPNDVRPDDVKPTEVKPAEVRPAEVKPDDVKPAEVKPPELKPPEVRPPEVKPNDVISDDGN